MIVPHLEIIRLEDAFPDGTFGALLIGTRIFCWTLEPPEFSNNKNISCIPPGQYECERYVSNKYATTYRVANVPERSGILFHAGNVVGDTKGCILLGETIGKLKGERAILNSGKTFTDFLNKLQSHDTFRLTIKESWR